MKMLLPSILSADFSRLGEQVKAVRNAGMLHVDVMDGHFVPNISFGAAVMKSLVGKTELPFDVHLMIEDPDAYAKDFVTPQTEFITVHQEACRHLHRSIQNVKSLGVKAGVAINPATPVSALECILADVDMVLVMSVNPGFGGQKFIPQSLDKVRRLAAIREEKGYGFLIEIDGGITTENVREATDAGVELAVAGSAVFGAQDIEERVRVFNEILK